MACYLTSVVLALIMIIYQHILKYQYILQMPYCGNSLRQTQTESWLLFSLSVSSAMSTDDGRVYVDWDTQTGWLTWCMVQ